MNAKTTSIKKNTSKNCNRSFGLRKTSSSLCKHKTNIFDYILFYRQKKNIKIFVFFNDPSLSGALLSLLFEGEGLEAVCALIDEGPSREGKILSLAIFDGL